jgi:hypothetical protein
VVAVLAVFAFPATVKAADVFVSRSDHLAPEDVGIQKYAFEATPAPGEEVVFREAIHQDDHLEETYDTVANTEGKSHKEFVLLLDRRVMNPAATECYRLQSSASAGNVDGQLKHWGPRNAVVNFVFNLGKDVSRKYVFTMFLGDCESAKERIPKLLEKGAFWIFAATEPTPPAGRNGSE